MWEEFLSACEYCNFQQRKLFLECSVVPSLGNEFPTRVRLLLKLKAAVFATMSEVVQIDVISGAGC